MTLLVLAVAGMLALPQPVQAEGGISLDLGGGSYTSQLVQIVALVTVLSLAPGILVMVTSFTRIVIVLSFLRSALGLQQTPPNPVLIGLALFLTAFVMGPTLQRAYEAGIAPYMAEQMDEATAFERASGPVREFMLAHTRAKDLDLFLDLAGLQPEAAMDTPLRTLVPAFMISELRRAFEIGFLIFIPFLVIDLLIASILMSMGMMMLPPVMISLPIKLIFFVLVDGWYLVAGSLVQSFQP
ncbi:flagellar type III secretion system pore protein FliP [Geminicoccus roseus]|uniref:flagellar type III secretion system pore protein FliP n=1 Tax=Geminicoccus roseus TaxID=404900 RepID=UPI00042186E7|nr:flagellar type III secretion system pore protein FliP [Geminicoccus roseus]